MPTTLLAVDDSNTMRKVLEITFAGEDYQTVILSSAEEALARVGSDRPQLALIDAGLAGDGYELCQKIKSTAPGTAVILLTSKHQPYDRTRGAQVGADDSVDKPFDTQQLLDRVKALVARVPSRPAAVQSAPSAQPAPRPRAQTLSYGTPTSDVQSARESSGQVRSRTPTLATGTPAQVSDSSRPPSPSPAFGTSAITTPGLAPAAAEAQAAANLANGHGLEHKLVGLGLNADQVRAVLALSREIVEQAVWEVVPTLAETMIREEIERLTRDA